MECTVIMFSSLQIDNHLLFTPNPTILYAYPPRPELASKFGNYISRCYQFLPFYLYTHTTTMHLNQPQSHLLTVLSYWESQSIRLRYSMSLCCVWWCMLWHRTCCCLIGCCKFWSKRWEWILISTLSLPLPDYWPAFLMCKQMLVNSALSLSLSLTLSTEHYLLHMSTIQADVIQQDVEYSKKLLEETIVAQVL